MNWRYVMGTVTIVIIVGGTIYAIKKSLDQDKAEDEMITSEEAQAMVARRKERDIDYREHMNSEGEEEIEDLVDECRDEASYNSSFIIDEEEEIEDSDHVDHVGDLCSTTIKFTTENFEETVTRPLTEEDKKLRHDPNSAEARKQYVRMELAEWSPSDDTYRTLNKLFHFPFNPKNDGDHDLKTHIIDYRVGFFGFGSKWTQEITFAEVLLHYARIANYNYNESVRYWVEYFLDFNQIHHDVPSNVIDQIIEALNDHTYFNDERCTFGLFGLTEYQINQASLIANRNIDTALTYEIEFNEFLKGCV